MFDFLFGWRKASKCKKLLRHAQCRLVLLKNKRCSIVRQLRVDVAELLKLGHAQIAFTRAEQIYKDERIIEVYDLLDHFCEFVVINMGYIRRHKDCPNDISEAMSSLIFASARCGDIPELRMIRKLFAERYGQRFIMSALELLPGNLVNCQIRNNLSIRPVVEDVKIKLVNEIFTDPNLFHGSSESPLALEYNSEWHQLQMKGNKVDEAPDNRANHNSSVKEDELLCITLPVSCPAEEHSSPITALVPVSQGLAKQENSAEIGIPGESESLFLVTLSHTSDEVVQCLDKNVVYLDDIQEFQSPISKDINLLDQRVFLFKSLVLPEMQKIMDDPPVVESIKRIGKVSRRKLRKRSLSREHWSFKDLSYESYYAYNQRKQLKSNTDFSCSKVCKCSCYSTGVDKTDAMVTSTNYPKERMMLPPDESSQSRSQFRHETNSANGMEETYDTEFYSCSDCSSRRSVSMPNEHQDMERDTPFVRHNSFPVRQLKHLNHIHPELPDYKELESAFLALKSSYLQNKNCRNCLI